MPIDSKKCDSLKAYLNALPANEAIVPVDRFFDGNDDLGSIGCNLSDHPGIDAFRDTLVGLQSRPDVEAVYARISEVDPGKDSWPFSDTILVVGTLSADELRQILSHIRPDEVLPGEELGVPSAIRRTHRGPVLGAWWD